MLRMVGPAAAGRMGGAPARLAVQWIYPGDIAIWLPALGGMADGVVARSFEFRRLAPHCGAPGVIFVAVDIGGTFTDLIGFDDEAGRFVQAKSLTTPAHLVQGIIDCIKKSGVAAPAIDELIHGSTIAINTLIERKGAKTGAGRHARHARRLHHRPRQPARNPTTCSSIATARWCRAG